MSDGDDHGRTDRLELGGGAAELRPADEPPRSTAARERDWVVGHDTGTRDTTPAVGTRGGPASWRRAVQGSDVALAQRGFGDARWSFLFKSADTRYAGADPTPGEIAGSNRRMRAAPAPEVNGPIIKPPVWTWEIPLYFWVGGVASGAAFLALACDVAGDARSAEVARKVALGAVAPAPLLLIADLGRPERFLNMLRIFKPRSPMNMGAWCLMAFGGSLSGAVGADLLRAPRTARALGALTGVLSGYLGSYTGALLACTAVPVWARSRSFLGPVFLSAATATGAAAVRLALDAGGLPDDHPTGRALGTIEAGAVLAELTLSTVNERRLGVAGRAINTGQAGWWLRAAKASVLLGLSARLLARPTGVRTQTVSSALYLAGGLAFRYAWVSAGTASALDHASVAQLARGRPAAGDRRRRDPRMPSVERRPLPLPLPKLRRAWSETQRRASLAIEAHWRG